jgi:hypothetical protein
MTCPSGCPLHPCSHCCPQSTCTSNHDTRAQRMAKLLLAAPDPLTAIAHHLAEQEIRIDAAMRRIKALERKA